MKISASEVHLSMNSRSMSLKRKISLKTELSPEEIEIKGTELLIFI